MRRLYTSTKNNRWTKIADRRSEREGRDVYTGKKEYKRYKYTSSDLVDVDLLVFSELERALALLFAEGLRLVDLRIFGELAVCLH